MGLDRFDHWMEPFVTETSIVVPTYICITQSTTTNRVCLTDVTCAFKKINRGMIVVKLYEIVVVDRLICLFLRFIV